MKVLLEILKCIMLGLVQGLGEFLPISSSGHLLLFQGLFKLTEGGHLFTVLLHVATLAAVCIVYREQIWALIKKPIQWKTLWLIAATALTAAVMLFMEKALGIETDSFSAMIPLLGFFFLGTSLMLAVAEYAKHAIKRIHTCNTMKWYHSVLIGVLQGVAILPGVSRSGATLTGAFLCGIKKKDAAEFSFLLSIPAILGGAILKIPDIPRSGLGDYTWYGTVIAMIVAGVSGYFAIRFMLRLITKKSFNVFIIYTFLLGVFTIIAHYALDLFSR